MSAGRLWARVRLPCRFMLSRPPGALVVGKGGRTVCQPGHSSKERSTPTPPGTALATAVRGAPLSEW